MKRVPQLSALLVALLGCLYIFSQPAEITITTIPVKLNTAALVPARVASSTSITSTTKNAAVSEIEASRTISDADLSTVASSLSASLVNILCTVRLKTGKRIVSGTGVFVSPRGMILTNAHLGQFFLFKDSKAVSCQIRMGNPAVATYKAEIAYLSPAWLDMNSDMLEKKSALGTGEHDVALIAVTDGLGQYVKPSVFPYVPIGDSIPKKKERLALVSYAAQYLTNDQINTALYRTVALGAAREVYTFSSSTPDIMTFAGSTIAQHGSSGGGVVNAKGQLAGMIVTSKTNGDFASRIIGAITAPYIRREFQQQMEISIDTYLAVSTTEAISTFANKAASLRSKIARYIAQN